MINKQTNNLTNKTKRNKTKEKNMQQSKNGLAKSRTWTIYTEGRFIDHCATLPRVKWENYIVKSTFSVFQNYTHSRHIPSYCQRGYPKGFASNSEEGMMA